jgi:aryl-alcohol dehydrogenase-like predicted oxidoreductase
VSTTTTTWLRPLGASTLSVAPLTFGGNVFGWTTDAKTSFALLDAFVAGGFNLIDTADVYSRWAEGLKGGEAETIIGEWLKHRDNRRHVVLATKVRGRMWDGPNGEGLSRTHILRAVEDSLRRLGTDYIDLYQTHSPDDDTPIDETLRALDDLVRQGKVRYIGCSNHKSWQLVEALLTARHAGLSEYVSVQPHWSLVNRAEFERETHTVVQKYGLGVIPYSPLGRGFLTGKYRRGQTPDSKRLGSVQKLLTEKNFTLLDKLDEIGRARGKTPGQIALAWLLSRDEVTAPIIGANTPAQLADSLGAVGLRLSVEEVEALDDLSAWKEDAA